MIKVCYINPERNGIGYHRLEIPFHNLSEDFKDLKVYGTNGFTAEHLPTRYDIIVLNRHSWQSEPYIEMAKDAGVKIILDLDDIIEISEWHGAHDGINTPQIVDRIYQTIDMADGIWCASEYLQSTFNKESTYIPNAIDFTQPQFIPQPKKMDRYTIGWVGAANHIKDIELLYEPLKKLLSRKDYNILLGGVGSGDEETVKYWQYVEGLMTSAGQLPTEHFIKIERQTPYNYAFIYNLMDCVLAPLAKGEFQKCKSNIKIIEAGAFSLPVICSNIEPYKEFIDAGVVYPSAGQWDKTMKELISAPIKGQRKGALLHEYVREHFDIKKVNQKRYDSIINVMDQRA